MMEEEVASVQRSIPAVQEKIAALCDVMRKRSANEFANAVAALPFHRYSSYWRERFEHTALRIMLSMPGRHSVLHMRTHEHCLDVESQKIILLRSFALARWDLGVFSIKPCLLFRSERTVEVIEDSSVLRTYTDEELGEFLDVYDEDDEGDEDDAIQDRAHEMYGWGTVMNPRASYDRIADVIGGIVHSPYLDDMANEALNTLHSEERLLYRISHGNMMDSVFRSCVNIMPAPLMHMIFAHAFGDIPCELMNPAVY